MKTIKSASLSFVPAGHENYLSPGVLKKILLEKADLQPGRIQMVNWASLSEDMQEIFVIVQGEAEITVGTETATLRRGDAVVIDPHEIHQMLNSGTEVVEYLAIGITSQAGGKTVVVEE